MMGFSIQNDIKFIRRKLLEDSEYFNEKAINSLASSYNRWKSSPAGLPTMGPAAASATIIKYNPQYSSSSKYTYQSYSKFALHSGNIYDTYGSQNYWSKPKWGSRCYTFSVDRSEMIVWSTSDPENRDYYRLIDVNDLMPNTDFLY